jgi:hypothetical protein
MVAGLAPTTPSQPPPYHPAGEPWSTAEQAILLAICDICPLGHRRWFDPHFVDVMLMGRLRTRRTVEEVMAWGQRLQPTEPAATSADVTAAVAEHPSTVGIAGVSSHEHIDDKCVLLSDLTFDHGSPGLTKTDCSS